MELQPIIDTVVGWVQQIDISVMVSVALSFLGIKSINPVAKKASKELANVKRFVLERAKNVDDKYIDIAKKISPDLVRKIEEGGSDFLRKLADIIDDTDEKEVEENNDFDEDTD